MQHDGEKNKHFSHKIVKFIDGADEQAVSFGPCADDKNYKPA